MSFLSSRTPWFSFIVHARHITDLNTFRGASLVRRYSATEEEYVAKLCTHPPIVAGEVSLGAGGIRGEIVAVVRTPQLILSPEGGRQVAEAVRLAASRGSRVIGLGALTSPITRGGERLVGELPPGVTLTNGNAFTAMVVRDNVDEVGEALALARPIRVAVVGCTGSVGAVATRLLAERDYELILIGRSERRVRQQLPDLCGAARVSGDAADVRDADVIVLLTDARAAHLAPEMVRPGTVAIDIAHPAGIPHHERKSFLRVGCPVVEGGLVRIPRYACTQEFFLPDPRDTFACLAETYLFAREGLREHSVGTPSVKLAHRLERAARRHRVAPRPLSAAQLIRQCRHNRPKHDKSAGERALSLLA
jgi:fatty aldehyde-generating acyl-ACP reductase